jgi:hypothetical protein
MIYYTFIGVLFYVFGVWVVWSNNQDSGETNESFKDKLYDQRQEIAVTLAGAILFILGGEGLIDSLCDACKFFWGEKAEYLCVSIQVNNEEMLYIAGGALFGSLLWIILKVLKNKANKKINE